VAEGGKCIMKRTKEYYVLTNSSAYLVLYVKNFQAKIGKSNVSLDTEEIGRRRHSSNYLYQLPFKNKDAGANTNLPLCI
jgi:hypothetical protein